jgi:drug/metabolite transporter (DMT)-like permease
MKRLLENKNLYGALLIVSMGAISALMNSLTHSLDPIGSEKLPALQILFMKSSIGLLTLIVIFRQRTIDIMKTPSFSWHMAKGLLGMLGNWAFILSLQHLSIATCSALSLTSALLTSLGAMLFFQEHIRWQVWGCTILGFGGVLIVLHPSGDFFSPYALLPLLSALAFSGSSLLIKVLCRQNTSETILLYLMFFMALFSMPFALYQWQPITALQTMKIIGIGVLYTLTQLMLIEAYTYSQASFISPFKYTRFPLNIGAEILFFSRWPKGNELWGGILIAASSLYLVWSERNKNKD